MALAVKNLSNNAGDVKDEGSIPGSGGSPGGGHGNPLQSSCLENPMDRGAWWATVHRVAKSQTQLKQLSMHTCIIYVEGRRGEKRIINRTRRLRLSSVAVQLCHDAVISCITLLARTQRELKHIGPDYLKHHHASRKHRVKYNMLGTWNPCMNGEWESEIWL